MRRAIERSGAALLFLVTAWVAAVLVLSMFGPVKVGHLKKWGDVYIQCERRDRLGGR